jgi:hypothetical protein
LDLVNRGWPWVQRSGTKDAAMGVLVRLHLDPCGIAVNGTCMRGLVGFKPDVLLAARYVGNKW